MAELTENLIKIGRELGYSGAELQTLSLEQQNYNYLKQALLKKFLCTAADYNNKFRNAIPLPSEDADAFISRLEMVFDRWVELSEIEKGNYEQLRDLILRDQIYSSLHSDIVMFLKERSPKSVKEIRSLAEKYRTAYPSKPLAKDHSILANVGVSKTNGRKQDETKEQENRQSRRDKWHHQHIDGPRAQSCGPPRFCDNSWTAPRQMHQWHHSPSQRGYRGNRRRNSYSYNSQRGFSRGPYRSYNDRNYTPANREYASSSSIMTSSPGSRKSGNLNLFPGSVNNIACSVLRDTGCSTVGIKSSFIKPEDYTGETTTCVMFDGSECTLPTAHAHIDTPFFKGNVIALVVSSPVADIILGNIIGINDSTANENNVGRHEREPDSSGEQKFVNVITRAQKKLDENINNRDTHTHSQLEKSHDSEINLDSLGKLDKHTFRIEQECDRSLDLLREKAAREDSYYYKEGLLYRQAKKDNGTDQLVVPCSLRELIMKCCHDIPIAGHMGIGATKKRVCSRFSWPGVMQDIIRFVKSCITCQKHCNKLPRLPIQQADIVDRPFDKVAIDIVGPLTVTDNKCRYILTLIDTATRWPEAVPLREIRTTDVASALFNIFSRLGLPKQILSDNGQQLVSKAMSEVMEMMGIERKLSTPYHAQSNGMVERFNGTLKNMLQKLTVDKPNSWDKLIPAVLFAFREIPNTTTGYPPFTLMYGIFAQDRTISLRNIHSSTITPTSYTKTSLKLVRLQPRTLELNSLNTEKREAHIQDTESFQKEIKSLFCYHKTATICLCDTKDLTAYRKSRMTTITYVKSEKNSRPIMQTYSRNLKNVNLSHLMIPYCLMQQYHSSKKTMTSRNRTLSFFVYLRKNSLQMCGSMIS